LYETNLHDFLSGKQHIGFHERDGVSQDIHVLGQEVKEAREKASQPRFIRHRQRGHNSDGHLPPAQSKRSAHERSLIGKMTNRTIPSSSKCSFAGPVRLSSISGTISGSIVNVEVLAAYDGTIECISLIYSSTSRNTYCYQFRGHQYQGSLEQPFPVKISRRSP
jgi:hypothetical protein